MPDYQRMYTIMFRAAELAIRSLKEEDGKEQAIFTLMLAQAACEEIYLSDSEGT